MRLRVVVRAVEDEREEKLGVMAAASTHEKLAFRIRPSRPRAQAQTDDRAEREDDLGRAGIP